MGCFNGTCGISHLPIRYGEPVVAFLIGTQVMSREENIHSGYCYVNGFYQPLTLPIFARYNEYGGIEAAENTYVLELIRKKFNLAPEINVVGWINDLGIDGFSFPYDNKVGNTSNIPVGLWMTHRKIFDNFKNAPGDWYLPEGVYKTSKMDAKLFLDDFYDEHSLLNKEVKNKIKLFNFFKNSEQKKEELKNIYDMVLDPRSNYIRKTSHDNFLLMALHYKEYGYASNGLLTYDLFETERDYFIDVLLNKEEDKINELVQDLIGSCCLDRGMSSIRVGYCPQSGSGSQEQEYENYLLLMEAMKSIIDDANERDKE